MPLRSVHEPQRTERRVARVDVSRGAGRVEVDTEYGIVREGTVKHGQHEFAVLHRGYGSRRLPAEKFLHIVPVVAVERRELARQARQQVNSVRAPCFTVLRALLPSPAPVMSPLCDGGSGLGRWMLQHHYTRRPHCR